MEKFQFSIMRFSLSEEKQMETNWNTDAVTGNLNVWMERK